MRSRIVLTTILIVGLVAGLSAQRGGRKVTGTVSDGNGTAIAGAAVQYEESGKATQTTTTDSKGSFEFASGTLGVVTVTAPPHATARRRWPPMRGSGQLNVVLSPPAYVAGGVMDASTGAALAASVTVLVQDEGNLVSSSTETASGGLFELKDLPSGPAVLMATAEGFAPYWSTLTLEKGEQERAWSIRLLLDAGASGTVVDADGQPVRSAWVAVGYTDSDGGYGLLESFVGGEPWTNADGEFRIYGLIPDVPIALQAEAPDGTFTNTVTVRIPPGTERQNIALTLP